MGSKSKTKKDEIKSTTKYRNGTKESKKGKCSGYKKYVDQKSFVGKKEDYRKNYEGKFGIIIGYAIGSKSTRKR